MAAPSIDAAYRSPDPPNSEKFNLLADVEASTMALRHRNLLAAMLLKNQFGDELWMETNHIAAQMGRVCNRRHPGTITRIVRGRHQTVVLGPCETASRRTVQRLIDDLVYCATCGKSQSRHPEDHAFEPRVEGGGVLDELYDANSHVPYGGGKKFRPSATYRFCRDRLTPRQTSDEYVQKRESRRKRKVPQRVEEIRSTPPAAAKQERPAENRPSRRFTRDERMAIARIYMELRKNGSPHDAAVTGVCEELKALGLQREDVDAALKIALAKKAEQEEGSNGGGQQTSATIQRADRIDQAIREGFARNDRLSDEADRARRKDSAHPGTDS